MRTPVAWVVAAAALPVLMIGCHSDENEPAPVEPHEQPMLFRLTSFTSAPRVDGGEVTLSALRGQVVLLDLFGTWCPPCRHTTPLLVSLYERYRRQGFEVVGLAYEQTGDAALARASVEAFAGEFQVPYVLALGPDAVWPELREKAGAKGTVPTILLLDRQGVVRDMFEALPPGHEAILADRIERLLAEPAVPVPKAEP